MTDIPVTKAEHVTDSVMETVWLVINGWYSTGRIDWEDVWDRLDGYGLDMGGELDSPAMRKIQRLVRESRKQG